MSYQEYSQLGKDTRRDRHNPISRQRSDSLLGRLRAISSISSLRRGRDSNPSDVNPASRSRSDPGLPRNRSSLSAEERTVSTIPRNSRSSLHDTASDKDKHGSGPSLSWRPIYLQRKILSSFACIFVGLIIVIESLGEFSNRNAGVGQGSRALRYAWTCASVTVVVVLLEAWNRVDYQSKSAAPWIRMSRGRAAAENTLLLDYVGATHASAAVAALRKGDQAVACTATVAVILRILIVLSTGLFTLQALEASTSDLQIVLHTNFVNDGAGLVDAGVLSCYALLSLPPGHMQYYDGATSRFAFQQFSSDAPAGAEIQAEVDGFSASLDCEAASISFADMPPTDAGVQLHTIISTADCSVNMTINSTTFSSTNDLNQETYIGSFGLGSCEEQIEIEAQRIAVLFGTVNRTVSGKVTLSRSAQLLCQPTYVVSHVNVRKKDDTILGVDIASPARNRTFDKVQPWDIVRALFSSYENELVADTTNTISSVYLPQLVDTDTPMSLALSTRHATTGTNPPPSTFLDASSLDALATEYFQQHAAILASMGLAENMSPDTSAVAGSVILYGDRLVITVLLVHLMAILLGICFILTCVATVLAPRTGFLPRDPTTIIGVASLVAHSRSILQSLRGSGGGTSTILRERLSGSDYAIGVQCLQSSPGTSAGHFKIIGGPQASESSGSHFVQETEQFSHPTVLHGLVRLTAFTLVIVAIISLEIALRYSKSNNGFSDVDAETTTHLLWTVAPASLAIALAAYFASADFINRALAPYAILSRIGSFEALSLNYLDKFAPTTIWCAFRSRHVSVAAGTIALLTSSFLVVFIATAFSVDSIMAIVPVMLLSEDSFVRDGPVPDPNICGKCRNGTMAAALILRSNLSYPSFTYEDKNLPAFTIAQLAQNMTLLKGATITATLPAIRPSMSCVAYPQSDIKSDLQVDPGSETTVIKIDLPEESQEILITGPPNATTVDGTIKPEGDGNPIFFGAAKYRSILLSNETLVPHWTYVWGQLTTMTNNNETNLTSTFGLACNESIERISVAATFFGPSLTIMPFAPPVSDESTAEPVNVALPADSSTLYDQLANISTSYLLDTFFATLVSSRYAIPASSFGDARASQQVADAIVKQHNIIRTQAINEWNRQSSGATAAVAANSSAADNTTAAVFSGTLTATRSSTDPSATTASPLLARRRLVQDELATRVLQALLAATLVASAASWAFLPRANVIPRLRTGPFSIASTVALLADGNLFGLLGRDAAWQPVSELRQAFMDGLHVTMRFKLGWEAPRRRRRPGDGPAQKAFGISAISTGGWGGGEGAGLGLQARVGYRHRGHVRDWGWKP